MEKKQISTFLDPNLVNKLDNIVKKINNEYEITTNRNSLIEFTVETLLDGYEETIAQYSKEHPDTKKEDKKVAINDFDTIICPSNVKGLKDFIADKQWKYVRINEKNIPKIKYIALYVGKPISNITYYGMIESIDEAQIDGKKKYLIRLKEEPIRLEHPVVLGDSDPLSTRTITYTTLERLKSVEKYKDLNN